MVITIACVIVMGVGFLLARYVLELGFIESIIAAPLCVVALLLALLTLKWRSH
jgi:hydrogenase/urease accessory protein HupE